MAPMPSTQGSATGVAETIPVPVHPRVDGVHARPYSRQHGHPRDRSQPPHTSGEIQQGVRTPQTAAIRQQQLDLTGQFAGGEVEFIGDGRVLQGYEGKSAWSEDGMPPVSQAGADGAKGIERDPASRFHSLSTINVSFSIHRNLRSKKMSGPSQARFQPFHQPGLTPKSFKALSPIVARRDNADGDHPRNCEYQPVVVSKNPNNSRSFPSV